MEPGATWVERGADGRPYFVRKKLKLPLTRNLLDEALAPKRRSRSLFRYPRRDFLTMPAPVSNVLSLPAPTTESSTSQSTTPIILPSEQESMNYPLPYPAPYPLRPQTLQENYVISGQQHMLSQAAQYPFAPPGMHPTGPPLHPYLAHQPLPPEGQAQSRPRSVTAGDLKYKCGICGRFRSPRYHYQHPIPPGELPKTTVCKRCREAGTDSEESYDSTGRTTRYCRNRSRSRTKFSEMAEDRVVSDSDGHRAIRRSPTRVRVVERSVSRSRRLHARSYYQSDSLDSELDRLEIIEGRRRPRPRSPGVEIVERIRYIEDAPHQDETRETIYIEERAPTRQSSQYDEEYHDDVDLDLPLRFVSLRKHWLRITNL
jgi:hypothetical protein